MYFFLKLMLLLGLAAGSLGVSPEPPSDWIPRIAGAQMLYNDKPLNDTRLHTHVGNGQIATVIDSPSIYLAGVFNAAINHEAHGGPRPFRARVPSINRINVAGAVFAGEALDLEQAVFYRRLLLDGSNGSCQMKLEQRVYAHCAKKELLVTEVEIDASSCKTKQKVVIRIDTAGPSRDIHFQRSVGMSTPTWVGQVAIAEKFGAAPYVAFSSALAGIIKEIGTRELAIGAGQRRTFVFPSAFVSSDPLDVSPINMTSLAEKALALCTEAAALPATGELSLLATHVKSYSTTTLSSRVELNGNLELARVVNASFYALYASLSKDTPWSTSPGGTDLAVHTHRSYSAHPPILQCTPTDLAVHTHRSCSALIYGR
jgi:hypothetical protein